MLPLGGKRLTGLKDQAYIPIAPFGIHGAPGGDPNGKFRL